MDERELTKTQREAKCSEFKRTMKEMWTTQMESENDNEEIQSLPSHFKRYTIQDRRIIIEQPIREMVDPGKLYDGPKNAKIID